VHHFVLVPGRIGFHTNQPPTSQGMSRWELETGQDCKVEEGTQGIQPPTHRQQLETQRLWTCTAASARSPAGCPCLGGFACSPSACAHLMGGSAVSSGPCACLQSPQRLGTMVDALTAEGLAALPSNSAEESDVSSRTSGSSPGPGNGTGVFIPVGVEPRRSCGTPPCCCCCHPPAAVRPDRLAPPPSPAAAPHPVFCRRCCCSCRNNRPASWMAVP
jgi:hypothetical protein